MKILEIIKARKKPVVIEAVQYTVSNGHDIERWARSEDGIRNIVVSPVLEPSEDNPTGKYLQIHTLEGTMTAIPGMWIIKGVKGEFYACKHDVFEMTYEKLIR